MESKKLEEIKAKWLAQCGSCDAGLSMNCTCAAGDFRSDMAELVKELEELLDHAAHAAAEQAVGCSGCLRKVMEIGVEAGVDTALAFVEVKLSEAGHTQAAEFVRTGGARGAA